jgi:hypothetical protein
LLDLSVDFDRLMWRDRRALRIYLAYSGFVILLGGLLVILSFAAPSKSPSGSFLMRMGGDFIAAVSAFPLKEYLERYDRLNGMRLLKQKWDETSNSPDPSSEQARIREIVWNVYEKGAVG